MFIALLEEKAVTDSSDVNQPSSCTDALKVTLFMPFNESWKCSWGKAEWAVITTEQKLSN